MPDGVVAELSSDQENEAGAVILKRSPLTRLDLVGAVKTALAQAKVATKNYAGHSFCIGAATTAAAVGLEDSAIRSLGR